MEEELKFKEVCVIGNRPPGVPADWEIYNNSEFIAGDREWGRDRNLGKFTINYSVSELDRFSAAVDPVSPLADQYRTYNLKAGAVRLIFIDEQAAVKLALVWYKQENKAVTPAELAELLTDPIERRRLLNSYLYSLQGKKSMIEPTIVVGQRPGQIPAGWEIYNAPRPLFGDMEWELKNGLGWRCLEPLSQFLVAVDPEGNRAAEFREYNRIQDGLLLTFVDPLTAARRARDFMINEYKLSEEEAPNFNTPGRRAYLITVYLSGGGWPNEEGGEDAANSI